MKNVRLNFHYLPENEIQRIYTLENALLQTERWMDTQNLSLYMIPLHSVSRQARPERLLYIHHNIQEEQTVTERHREDRCPT